MIKEFAHAKINLTLDILGKRKDNFHEIRTIMQTLELADIIELEKNSGGIIFNLDAEKIIGGEKIPTDEKNLAYRAALELEKVCNKKFNVTINLTKNIPMAAGLAGGSSDAAAVLRGMNKLFKLNFSTETLCEIAANIGSDVPYCIIGGTCLAEGRGEILTPLKAMKNFSAVLVKPHGEVSTAWSYQTFDVFALPTISHPSTDEIIELLAEKKYSEAFAKFLNVLEPVALEKFPEIKSIEKEMISAGAEVALMSGSGPTVFALAKESNIKNISAVVKKFNAQVFVTKIL